MHPGGLGAATSRQFSVAVGGRGFGDLRRNRGLLGYRFSRTGLTSNRWGLTQKQELQMNKFFQSVKGKAVAAGAAVTSMFAASSAFAAEGDLSAAVIGELTSGKTEILAVGGAILVLVGVVALIRHVRAAAR